MSKIPSRPFLNQSFSPRGGGIDFLGMRAVNLRMLQEFLIPGINNATADFGTFCLAAWIPWKFHELAFDKNSFTLSRYREFREAVEIAVAYSQRESSPADERFGSPRTRIGIQQKVDLDKPLTFKEVKRTEATSLFAAPLYGPSLRYLKLITGDAVANDGTSTRIPLTSTDDSTSILVQAVESSLQRCSDYESFNRLEISELSGKSLDELGMHGLHPSYYRTTDSKVKKAFLRKFLIPVSDGDKTGYRNLTARLICESIRQHKYSTPADLRACWYSGLHPTGETLRLSDERLCQHRELWALFQARQIQRTISEVFLRCFEIALKNGADSVKEVVSHWRKRSPPEFKLDSWSSLDDFVRHEAMPICNLSSLYAVSSVWHATVHEGHLLYDDVVENSTDAELWRACRMLARWRIRLQKWLTESKNVEFLNLGGRSRMSLRWFAAWVADRMFRPLSDVVEDIFSELVFSQHIQVALSRFDGQVQRLRFTLGDSGIIPTTEAAKKMGQPPVRMADRLTSFMGLLADLDVIKWVENEPLQVGIHADYITST